MASRQSPPYRRGIMDSPPPYHGLYAYVWDVAPEDPDGLAAELHGWGIDTLWLAASYHAGKFIRPHATGSRVFFPEDGGVDARGDLS